MVVINEELSFTIVVTPSDYYVDYVVYDIEAWGEGETPRIYDRPLWPRKGSTSSPDSVDTLSAARPYLHGSVAWDGCSNWHFDEQDRVMLHGCSRKDVLRLGEVMALCWDMTESLCSHWTV